MAAAVVAVLSPVVSSTCEPLSAAAVGAGAAELQPSAIGTPPPSPPSTGLSTAKVTGTVFPNAVASAAIIINNNNIITTRGVKPNYSSSTSINNGTAVTTSSITTTDSSLSFATASPIITSSVNYKNTCEQKTKKHSAITRNITGTTNSISSPPPPTPSSTPNNRSVIIIKTTSPSITDCTADDGTAEIRANTTTCPDLIPATTTTTTTKTGTTIRATTEPPPPSAPTIATTTTATTTTSIIATSVVASSNIKSNNSLCNKNINNISTTSGCSSSGINSPTFISTKTTTTNSTSNISATLKANGIVSGFPSLDINGRSTSTSRIFTNGEDSLRASSPIVKNTKTMGPEEDGYPDEVVSNPNDGTASVIIGTGIASTNQPSTVISTNVLGTTKNTKTTADCRRKPQNSCIGFNDTNNTDKTKTNHLSLKNNEHNHKINNINNTENSGFNIQQKNAAKCIKNCPPSVNNSKSNTNRNNDNDNIESADNKHCTIITASCSINQTDTTLRIVDRGASNCSSSSSSKNDNSNDSTRDIRKYKHQHLNHNDDDDDGDSVKSIADDSDFDSRYSGVDSFSCQPKTTTPSNDNNNNSSSSSSHNSIDSCGGSSIVSTSITSTCATNSTVDLTKTTRNNNTRSSSSSSKSVITNGTLGSLLSTSSSSIIVPAIKTKFSSPGVTKNNNNKNHTKNTNYDLDPDTNTDNIHNAKTQKNQRLSKVNVAPEDESIIDKSLILNNNAISTRSRITDQHSQDNELLQGGEEETDYYTQQNHRIHRSPQEHRPTTTTPEKPNRTLSPPRVLAQAPPPPSMTTTTTRKNKRKLSAPRKRTDFNIKRFCRDINNGGEDVDSDEEDFAPETKGTSHLLGSAQEISGVDTEKNRARLSDETPYDRVELEGDHYHQPLLLNQRLSPSSSRPLVTQLGHPSTRGLLETADMYCRSLGRITPPTRAGHAMLDLRGDVCPSPTTSLPLHQRLSHEDEVDDDDDDDDDADDDDDDDDADDGDDEVEDLDEDLIDPYIDIEEELGAAADDDPTTPSLRSHLRSLGVTLSHSRRHRRRLPVDGGGVVVTASGDEAGNPRRTSNRGSASRTGVIRSHHETLNTSSRHPVSSTTTRSNSETVSSGREQSINASIPTAHSAAAAAAGVVVVPGSLSPLTSIPPPPQPPPLPLTSHLNGFVHHHHNNNFHFNSHHHHIIHGSGGVEEGVAGGFKSSSSGGVGLELNSGGGSSGGSSGGGGKKPRKNYKNMTRERRIEANARERSRVHTISAAFENLRRAVPSYSCNQKLSKLAILRIACCYILALARLADMDYSEDQNAMSFDDCVDLCTKTIQTEGRARRRH